MSTTIQDLIDEDGLEAVLADAELRARLRDPHGGAVLELADLEGRVPHACCDRCGRIVTADMIVDASGLAVAADDRLPAVVAGTPAATRAKMNRWWKKPVANLRWICDGCWRWPVQAGWITPAAMRKALGMSPPKPHQTL